MSAFFSDLSNAEWHHWFHYSNNHATLSFFLYVVYFVRMLKINCNINSLRVRTQHKIKHTVWMEFSAFEPTISNIDHEQFYTKQKKSNAASQTSLIVIISKWNSNILRKVLSQLKSRANVVPKTHNKRFVLGFSRIPLFRRRKKLNRNEREYSS